MRKPEKSEQKRRVALARFCAKYNTPETIESCTCGGELKEYIKDRHHGYVCSNYHKNPECKKLANEFFIWHGTCIDYEENLDVMAHLWNMFRVDGAYGTYQGLKKVLPETMPSLDEIEVKFSEPRPDQEEPVQTKLPSPKDSTTAITQEEKIEIAKKLEKKQCEPDHVENCTCGGRHLNGHYTIFCGNCSKLYTPEEYKYVFGDLRLNGRAGDTLYKNLVAMHWLWNDHIKPFSNKRWEELETLANAPKEVPKEITIYTRMRYISELARMLRNRRQCVPTLGCAHGCGVASKEIATDESLVFECYDHNPFKLGDKDDIDWHVRLLFNYRQIKKRLDRGKIKEPDKKYLAKCKNSPETYVLPWEEKCPCCAGELNKNATFGEMTLQALEELEKKPLKGGKKEEKYEVGHYPNTQTVDSKNCTIGTPKKEKEDMTMTTKNGLSLKEKENMTMTTMKDGNDIKTHRPDFPVMDLLKQNLKLAQDRVLHGAQVATADEAKELLMEQVKNLLGDAFPTGFYNTPLGKCVLDLAGCFLVQSAASMYPTFPGAGLVQHGSLLAMEAVSRDGVQPLIHTGKELLSGLAKDFAERGIALPGAEEEVAEDK